ncbi:MAG: hypothetical protein HY040_27075 [Planctomycetes bacterium]|nr:hypothetical protein [Planctomycetota bacterium]
MSQWFTGTGRIVLYEQTGNDVLRVPPRIHVPVEAHSGTATLGNDMNAVTAYPGLNQVCSIDRTMLANFVAIAIAHHNDSTARTGVGLKLKTLDIKRLAARITELPRGERLGLPAIDEPVKDPAAVAL